MGLYADCIFPFLLDHGQPAHLTRLRAELLAPLAGRVLEIGMGTGLNLPHYPAGVESLVGLEPERGMLRRASRRRAAPAFAVRCLRACAERLPFPDACFDAVVSTCTLCTVEDVGLALEEIARVLRPGGRFHFLEHGLANRASTIRWQRRIEPLHRCLARGCHVTRDLLGFLEDSPLDVAEAERFTLRGAPRYVGQMVMGTAVNR